MKIIPREIPAQQASALRQAGVHPLLAQLYAARGVCSADELDDTPARLLPPSGLLGMEAAVRLLDDAIERDRKSTRLNSSHSQISYAVFCLKKKKINKHLY